MQKPSTQITDVGSKELQRNVLVSEKQPKAHVANRYRYVKADDTAINEVLFAKRM